MEYSKIAVSLFQTPGANTDGEKLQQITKCDKWTLFTYERQKAKRSDKYFIKINALAFKSIV